MSYSLRIRVSPRWLIEVSSQIIRGVNREVVGSAAPDSGNAQPILGPLLLQTNSY